MALLGDIRAASQLWIVADSQESDVSQLCQQLQACNQARDKMLSGEISFDDLLDVLADNSVDLEDWADTTLGNLEDLDYDPLSAIRE